MSSPPQSLASDSPAEVLELNDLLALGPEIQRDMDFSLIEANLRLTPQQRIQAQSSMIEAIQTLRQSVRAAHG